MHRAIAERLRTEPEILQRARACVAQWIERGEPHDVYAREWARLLVMPLDQLAAAPAALCISVEADARHSFSRLGSLDMSAVTSSIVAPLSFLRPRTADVFVASPRGPARPDDFGGGGGSVGASDLAPLSFGDGPLWRCPCPCLGPPLTGVGRGSLRGIANFRTEPIRRQAS